MKDMRPDETERTEETEDKTVESTTTQSPMETIKQLQAEAENSELELRKARHISSWKIGIVFAVPGALSLIFSILNDSQILAFIGLGLTFWGILFFFVRPKRYVKSSLLDSTVVSSYFTIDRIVKDLEYEGTLASYYIPPYPKEVYLPEHLRGLKDMIVFISADRDADMPSIAEMAEGKFLFEHPRGICVAPPGLGLLTQFEKQLRIDITRLELSELCESLPPLILEDFQLAKDIEMKTEKNQVYLKIVDSIYKNLYSREENLKSIHFLGCPLVSAMACAITKTTGKLVEIHRDEISPDGRTIEVWCGFAEG